ncbi:MAG: hypothetical protein ACR2OI_05960 [Acidimicrobiia bacterium]
MLVDRRPHPVLASLGHPALEGGEERGLESVAVVVNQGPVWL